MKKQKSNRRFSPAGKILIAVLACAACVFFALAGMHAYRALSRSNAVQTYKAEKETQARGFAKIVTSGTLNSEAVLKTTEDAGWDYIDETLFLGDSNTVRFMMFLDSEGRTFTTEQNTIAVVGMGCEGITTVPCMQFYTGTYTMCDSVAILQPRRIIMTFGTNNLDCYLMNAELFIESYEPQIQAVMDAYPYADVIINSIPPLGEYTDYSILTTEQLLEYNQAILKMCEKNHWKFLNSFEALADSETGYAKAEYIEYDGVHYNAEGLAAMFRYIRTHAWISEDRRPQPLDEIPYIIGPITEIYTVDPLSNEEFSDDVLNPDVQQAQEEYVPEEVPAEDPQEPYEETEDPEPDPSQEGG